MSLVLAIESDPRQQGALTRIVRERVRADLIVVDSKDAAIRSINDRLPDLILLTALFSPRDEEELVNHLRTLKGAEHLQTLTIPLLATGPFGDDDKPKRGLFGKKRSSDAVETHGCAPGVFAEQVAGYLKTATELKAAAEAQAQYAARTAAAGHADRSTAEYGERAARPTTEHAPSPRAEAAPEPTAEAEAQPYTVDDAFTWRPAAERHARKAAPEPEPEPAPPPPPAVEPGQRPPLLGFTTTTLGELLEKEQAALSGKVPVEPSAVETPPVPAPTVEAQPIKPPPVETPKVEAPHVEPPPVKVPPIAARPVAPPPIEAPAPRPVEPPPPPAPARPIAAPPVAPKPPVLPAPPVAPTPPRPAVAPVAKPAPPKPAPIQQPPGPLVERLPPLAMWARIQASSSVAAAAPSEAATAFDAADLLGALRVPVPIATIAYPRGVHLHRVRVVPSHTEAGA